MVSGVFQCHEPAPPTWQRGLPCKEAPVSDFLTSAQVAQFLGLHPLTLNQWRSRNTGPAYIRVGRSIRYSRADIDAWLAQHRRVPEFELSDPAVTLTS